MSVLSVVIPTYNRCQTLRKVISAYFDHATCQRFSEIIVVDDGSTDSTGSVVAELANHSTLPIRYFRQENKGPAAARNLGVREARGEIVLFTDDDILPTSSLVSEHLDWHRRFPDPSTAVLGNVMWAEDVRPTPFMHWYGSDSMFLYSRFVPGAKLDYTDFYTCNLSLKTAFLRRCGMFDEEFKIAAFEDIELGYRLKKAGMQLLYNPNALAYHQQFLSFDDACRRARKAELSAEIFKRKEAGVYFCSQMDPEFIAQTALLSPARQRGNLKKLSAWLLSPLKRLMDWRVPLPWSVYRMMLRIYR